jgi:precorrin-6B methylase 2
MRWNPKQRVICLAVVMSLVWSGAAFYGAQDTATKQKTDTKKPKKTEPDVIFVPTPQPVVDAMLKLAKLKKGEMVYDLGCGDGRIVVTAAKMGAKGKGFDVDPRRIKESKENVKKNKVEKEVQIIQEDIFELDLKEADVITLYLLPRLNVKLIPQLDKLRKGVRIVSHSFNMEGVEPDKEETVDVDGSGHTIYLWTTPLKKTGDASKKTS